MTNEALLDAYEKEWRCLMDKINEIEHRIVQLKKDIAIEKSAQHGVHLTPMGAPKIEEDLPEFGTGGWMSAR